MIRKKGCVYKFIYAKILNFNIHFMDVMKMRIYPLFVIASLIFISQFAEVVSIDNYRNLINGRILYVGGSGENNYSKIQDAIDNASDGDTIFVYSGVYYENIVINKSISLVGENREKTIIKGCNRYRDVINITASNVIVRNFKICNASILYPGIKIYTNNNKILNCNISSNDVGILIYSSSDNKISGCSFFNNTVGIDCKFSDENLFLNCSILRNGNGIRFHESSHNKMEKCYIALNKWGGIGIEYSSSNIISNNTFVDNGISIYGDELAHFIHDIDNNTINNKPLLYYKNAENVKISNMEAGEIIITNCKNFSIESVSINGSDIGIEIAYSSDNIIKNCSILNCKSGILLYFSSENIISKNEIAKIGHDGISLSYSSNNHIVENNVSECEEGIFTWSSSNNTISKNNINKNGMGILIFSYSYYNIVSYNNISYNDWFGISLQGASFNKVVNNEISHNKYWCGISIVKSWTCYNIISENNISYNNWCGIHVEGIGNVISKNNVAYNTECGAYLSSWLSECKRNIIAKNNFVGNGKNAGFYIRIFSFNIWYRNYWDGWKIPFPKPIFGIAFFPISPFLEIAFPWVNFDIMPRLLMKA